MLLSIYQCYCSSSSSFPNCLKTYPAPAGKWFNNEPYWQPTNCPRFNFRESNTRNCLQNTTFYVIGNSIPRSMMFTLVEMLGGGDHVNRTHEKYLCPKDLLDGFEGDSCHLTLNGVKLKYLYLTYFDAYNYSSHFQGRSGFNKFIPFNKSRDNNSMAAPNQQHQFSTPQQYLDYKYNYTRPDVFEEVDGCSKFRSAQRDGENDGGGISSCIANFFKGSTAQDVLLFSLGQV